MPLKPTLAQIADSFAVLSELYSHPLKISLKIKLGRILTECERELKRFELEHRDLLKRFGAKESVVMVGGESRTQLRVPDENLEAFQPEYLELANCEIELHHFPVAPSEFEQSESIHCKCGVRLERTSPEIKGDITKLFWLIREDIDSNDNPSAETATAEEAAQPIN